MCMCMYVCVCMYVCMYVCLCVCVWVCVCVSKYTISKLTAGVPGHVNMMTVSIYLFIQVFLLNNSIKQSRLSEICVRCFPMKNETTKFESTHLHHLAVL